MTPSLPDLPKRCGERAAGTEMFFTPASARALEREFYLTGASTTGARALRTKRGTWSLIITDLSADAERRVASRPWQRVQPSQGRRGRGLAGSEEGRVGEEGRSLGAPDA